MRTRLAADCTEKPLLWAPSSKDRTASAVLPASTKELEECCSSLSSAAGLCFVLGAASATIGRLETGARRREGLVHCLRQGVPCSGPVLMTTMLYS